MKKPRPELRKLIRSHVMLGKNSGKTYYPRARKPRKPKEKTAITDGDVPESFPLVTIPRKFGSDLSTIPLADTVEPAIVDVVLRFSSIAKQVLFPLETCIFFEGRAEAWIAPLTMDPAFLHAMIFTSQYYFDTVLSKTSSPVSQRTMPHYLKTLSLLRERFAHGDDQARLSNTTAVAILGLAGHAHLTGDAKSAKHHLEGLHKIVSLRGGMGTFKSNVKLLVETLRCDLGIALHNGTRPLFFDDDPFSSGDECSIPYPDLTSLLNMQTPSIPNTPAHSTLLNGINKDLARAWQTMSDFCAVISYAVDSRQRISTDIFLDTMSSVMYRLLVDKNNVYETNTFKADHDEAIRLGLLAFSCSVFLQWRSLGQGYAHFTAEFRGFLQRTLTVTDARFMSISPQFAVWLLMVGAVSVLDAGDDEWLRPLLSANVSLCGIDGEWSNMQQMLRGFMWVGLVHDVPGKALFNKTVALRGQ